MDPVAYDLSVTDYTKFQMIGMWRRTGLKGFFTVALLAVLLQLLADMDRLFACPSETLLSVAVNGLLLSLFGFAVTFAFVAWAGGSVYRSSERLGSGKLIGWNNDRLLVNTEYANAAYPWELVTEWLETPQLIAVYLAPSYPLLFPKSAMAAEVRIEMRQKLSSLGVPELKSRLF